MSRNLLTALLLTALATLVASNLKWGPINDFSKQKTANSLEKPLNKREKRGEKFDTLSVNQSANSSKNHLKNPPEEHGKAAEAMDNWAFARTFPDGVFHAENLQTAFNQRQIQLAREEDPIILPEWQSLGPANIAGRMLCLAFHPTDSLTMWAGSASGGLWKTTTGGVGTNAWRRVKTGFPVLGVAAIAVSPDANTLYIGTGEVYGYRNAGNGSSVRTQRGSYGIGILKSTDGGATWTKSLDWSENNLRGVQRIVVNPRRPSTVFAATTEGVFRSYDAGKNWSVVNQTVMAVDLDYTPNDTNRLYATFGSLNNPLNGLFRSLDGGSTWAKMTNGLPSNYTGKALLTVSENQPNTLFASIANMERQIGLYKSTNGGDAWTLLNDNDVAAYQGWFSHDVVVNPQNPNVVLHVGVHVALSRNGGSSFAQISNSVNIPLGRTVDAFTNYLHADNHAVYFSPHNPNRVYFVNGGGVYRNDDLGERFQQINNGLQTTQFYANFSNSQQDSAFAIGGMQGNWTAIYDGFPNWSRVLDGDGMGTAIHPQDDNILFGSSQNLNVMRSTDRGLRFSSVGFGPVRGQTAFNAPFEFAPSNPEVMYAGSEQILRSDNAGYSFTDGYLTVDNSKVINTLAVNPLRDSSLFVATFPSLQTTSNLFKSANAGIQISRALGLPNRVFTDIAYHPKDTNVVFVTLSGFGTQHVYRTTDGGTNFQPFGANLPDIPTNTIVFDPIRPQFVYVGNDLGVYFSSDTGNTWRPLSTLGLPEACIVINLSISPVNRKLRAATHGNGVYEIDLLTPQNLRQPIEAVFAAATMETTNQRIRTNFYLKNTRRGDTIAFVLSSPGNARLALPSGLPTATRGVPDYPFPHPFSTTFNDTVFPFKLTPVRTRDPREGITTYDIALISRSILGVDTTNMTSPYKLLAADVNGDGSVDALDILLIRRLILLIDAHFAAVPQWVFIPKTYPMPAVPPRLDSIPQSYYFSAYSLRNPNPFGFTIIKMGDVNNSYEPIDGVRSPQNGGVDTRSEGVVLTTKNVELEAGNVYEIAIKASKSISCIGFQGTFGLNTEGVDFLNLDSKTLNNFGEANRYAAKNGRLTFSWNDVKNQTFDAQSTIFTLTFKAKKSGLLSNYLQLNSDATTATVFDEKGREQRLSLQFEKTTPNIALDVQPNPFSDVVNAQIDADTEGPISYAIFDEKGRQVFQNQQVVKKGDGVLRLNSATIGLQKTGVYFLKIETVKGSKTVKLVKI